MNDTGKAIEDCLKLAVALYGEPETYVACEKRDGEFCTWAHAGGIHPEDAIGSGATVYDAFADLRETLMRFCNEAAAALKEVSASLEPDERLQS